MQWFERKTHWKASKFAGLCGVEVDDDEVYRLTSEEDVEFAKLSDLRTTPAVTCKRCLGILARRESW